jgi:hypothetical protein
MPVRSVGKWACLLVIAWTGSNAVVSCGGSGDGSVFVDGGGGGMDSSIPTTDGNGGTHDGPSLVGDDGGGSTDSGCVAKTCAQLGYNCGKALQCGQVIDCTGGNANGGCTPPESCGGGGTPNVCGGASSSDGGPISCTPTTCQALAYNCGYTGDGCGDVLNCNPNDATTGCTPPAYCGGGGFNVCGGNNGLQPDGGVPCVPTTCNNLGYDCGYANDGCGNLLNCNPASGPVCPSPQYCGGGGFNVCGGNNGLSADGSTNCKPTTCAKLGFNCGPAGDGCGNLIASCGTCTGSNTCGGGGTPGVCGNSACTGLCLQQQTCAGGVTTTIKGTVFSSTPAIFGTPDPVPNVLVYVPNSPVLPFSNGVTCSQCGADVSGTPLVQTTTAFDGTFTLTNMPSGTSIPVVIQLGRWRNQFTVNVPSCTTTTFPAATFTMPSVQSATANIPLTAFSTGSVDTLECVMLKMGVAQSEFTTNTGGGRIHLYEGNGASLGNGTPAETALMGNGGTFANYDQILLPCWGVDPKAKNSSNVKTAAELANLVTYANEGGHFFGTHFSWGWYYQNSPFNTVAKWNVDHSDDEGAGPYPFTVQLPPTNPEGTVFSDWLHLVGAMPNPQTVEIAYPRHDVDSVLLQSVNWINGSDPDDKSAMQLHFTFNTPVGQTNQCGHAIFSDFHVANASVGPSTVFPAECMTNETTGKACTTAAPCPLTAQERILEYMIWDLASCVPGPPAPPNCTPITCQDQNIACGPAGNGCGQEITSCGTCTPPQTCGGGGVAGQCGAPDGGSCTPKTCVQQNIACGPAGDGCGNEIPSCGSCTPPNTCGGGGVPGQCGFPEAGSCQPETCADQMIFCGPAGDGCGGEIPSCGTCTPPQTCGGGGVGGQCGSADAGTCTPKSCAQQGIQCGSASDGCGNVLQCPPCGPGFTCNTMTQTCQQTSQ